MRNENESRNHVPVILIVDDIPDNLKVLGELLKNNGYKVRPVPNGKMALQVAEKEKPDLILLDIMMPDMDGFEVCRRLKENEYLNDIPIIFISALNDTKNIIKAFTSGGIDYITKPFQAEEVSARVATHLKICWQKNELHRLNIEKDKFFSILAHDLRNPFGGFMKLTEMMVDDTLFFSPEQQKEMMMDLSHSARNIFDLLNDLLEWSQMQRGRADFNPQLLGLNNTATECLKTVTELAKNKCIKIALDIPENQKVKADVNMLQTILRNLTSNAIKFTPPKGKITISSTIADNNEVVVAVNDNGIGMTKEILDNLFQIDVNTGRPGTEGEPSSGLGLILCKEFVEKHEGKIWVESEEGVGSQFYFTIPRNLS